MISYSIDASVYAYPFYKAISDPNDTFNFYKNILELSEVLFEKQPHDRKFYLFLRDIELIYDCEELNLIEQNDQILNNSNIPNLLRNAKNSLKEIFKKLLPYSISETNPLSEIIIFENWFNIENVIFKHGKDPSLLNEFNKLINNEKLRENIKKNIVKIAFLNKYVYNNENIHYIILSNEIKTQKIPICNIEFDNEMSFDFYSKYSIKYNYKIKNAKQTNIRIFNQNVNISTLNVLVNNYYNYKPGEWKKALNDAKSQFKNHIEFNNNVETNLIKYTDKIEKEYEKSFKYKEKKRKFEIEKWIEEGPNTLYENLKALYNFLTNANLKPIKKDKRERYHCCKKCERKPCPDGEDGYICKNKCDLLEICGSNIRYFGVDCTDERWEHYNDIFVKNDRTIKDNAGVENKYWMHLKPKSKHCDDPLWFLALRIHFRYIDSTKKIEIGWIGRHLYVPCPKRNDFSKCERPECPLNPISNDNDSNADELTNYLKQYK